MLSGIFKKVFSVSANDQFRHLKKSYINDFTDDSCILNYQRLRYWLYFLIPFSLVQIIADFLFTRLWTEKQLLAFRNFDVFMGLVALLMFYITHFKQPKKPADLRPYHKILMAFYIFSHLFWSAGIGGIESETSNGLPTFLIGVFSAATLFIVPATFFMLLLIISMTGLAISLYLMQVSFQTIVTQYYTVFILVFIAFISSRLIYGTRLRTYISSRELEKMNLNLNQIVEERTQELSDTNIQLKNEIEVRIRFERELKKALVRAEEADRLKTLFLANMSHEIRTPLNGILGFSDLLKSQEIPEEKRKRYYDIIYNSGQQLLKIIDDILDISMIESNQIKVNKTYFNLNDLMRNTFEFFYNYIRAEKGETITLNCIYGLTDGADRIYTDSGRLQQILYNLLKNSIKFTEKGTVTFGYSLVNDMIEFFVEDTGIGIKNELHEKIFERFTQSEEVFKRNYGGTGLGLAISKGIVECLGGQIWLDKEYSPGARFYFNIPFFTAQPDSFILDNENVSNNFSAALKNLGLK
jgi:signal transduction histidine kinase